MLFDETGKVVRCMECDRPAHHEHHVIPASRGGTRTIPLCVGCHGRVHDVEGWRTDTLKMLRAGKAGRDRRHSRVMRAFDERAGRLDDPPTLVRQRKVQGYRYDEWVPWLATPEALERKIKARRR